MPGHIEFEFTTQSKSPRGPRTESTPMRILLLGDFSAYGLNGAAKERPVISQRKLHSVDIDNLDQVMGRMAPELAVNLSSGITEHISFSQIDDFHPDSLFRRVKLFDELRDLRKRLHSRDSYEEAKVQLRTILSLQESGTSPDQEASTVDSSTMESDNETLDRLLGRPAGSSNQVEDTAESAADRLIGKVIKAHIVPETDAGQQVYFDAADKALSDLMHQVLHNPDFQTLEVLWRSVDFLITRLELDEDLQLNILDVSKDELLQDIRQSGSELEHSELYRLLLEQGVELYGVDHWSLMIGLYSFDNSESDTQLLAGLGAIGAHAGGPFIAQASTRLLGCDSLVRTPNPRDWNDMNTDAGQRWNALRTSAVAPWIGLVLPRLLLRLPYGEETDEIDSFVFEEVIDTAENQKFLWGSSAVGCAVLIGQAFTEQRWQMSPDDIRDIGELPAYCYTDDGESKLLPCAEVDLTETAANKILDHGLMPMIGLHNTNTVRLLRFQSIASPARALAGAWA